MYYVETGITSTSPLLLRDFQKSAIAWLLLATHSGNPAQWLKKGLFVGRNIHSKINDEEYHSMKMELLAYTNISCNIWENSFTKVQSKEAVCSFGGQNIYNADCDLIR